MYFALLIAAAFLALSVLLLFVWPLVLAGPGFRMRALMRPEARFLGGAFASALGMAALAPLVSVAVGSGGEALVEMAAALTRMEFDL